MPVGAPACATQQSGAAAVPTANVSPTVPAAEQQTAENAQKDPLEKSPVFHHKNVKEPIEDASMTFEELHIRKSDDFADLKGGQVCVLERGILRHPQKDQRPQGYHESVYEAMT